MEKYKEGWKQFISLCQETTDDKTLSTLFDLLFTPEEKENLSMRCLIIRDLLLQKQTQREIAKSLNVSIAKITRGSNEIKRMKDPFLNYLKTKLVK
ncbi:MAG: trp operon repressor [Gammaproteobacteria bacterium]|nr:trp operon repressor [Gammaproteobacteria bacterium]